MTRPSFRRSLRFDNLETREMLSGVTAAPTAQQQYMLELVNKARMNPQAAAEQYSNNLTSDIQATLAYYHVDLNATKQAIANSPTKPPLAWNPDLAAAAQAHSQDMVNNQYQSHTGSNGSTADQRMQNAGYNGASSTGENAYAYANSVDEAMHAFLLDWGVSDQGHRRNLLQANVSTQNSFKDTGIGIATAPSSSSVGPLVITQDFGSQPNEQAQLVGVVYSDNQHSGAYAIGEGQGGIQIDATNLATGQTTSTQTWQAGGYQISLATGQYQITASSNGTVIQTVKVTIGTDNVEQDFLLNQSWDSRSRDQVINSLIPPSSAPAPQSSPAPVTVSVPTQPAPASPAPTVNYAPLVSGDWTSWQAQVA
jgi:uncharacterized protein YkwD